MSVSNATTVAAYLKKLPAEKRAAIAAVRALVRKNLPKGYEEAINWGVISYQIPLARFPNTYNKQPLSYVGLGAKKNYNTLYMMRVYGDKMQEQTLRDAFRRAGKKLDMGKSCIHFKTPDDLPLPAIGALVASTTPEEFIAIYESSRRPK